MSFSELLISHSLMLLRKVFFRIGKLERVKAPSIPNREDISILMV